jgi:hypothetical protein
LAGCGQAPAPVPVQPALPDPSWVRFDAAAGEVEAFAVGDHRGADNWPATFPVTLDTAGAPPMLGTYTAEGPYVRFRPRFPFVPGTAYRAEFRAGAGGPAQTRFTVPAPPLPPPVEVTHVYPTAEQLPENLLRLYVHFSGPMPRGGSYDHIHLLDAAGKPIEAAILELDQELWDASGRRLTLLFDPGRVKTGLKPREELGPVLEAGKSYTLVIDKGWKDLHGRPLVKEFRKPIQATAAVEKGIDPAAWKVRPPKAGTRQPLRVTFPAPLDHALLQRVVTVEKDGKPLAGEVTVIDGETDWRFVPADDWAKGNYDLVAGPELEDVAGNRLGRSFEVDESRSADEVVKPARRRFVVE